MIRVVLELTFEDERKARAVYDALFPDDRPAPSYLKIESRVSGSTLIYIIELTGGHDKIWTLRSTVDQILAAAKLAESVVDAAGK